jgi:hypothetical protein
MLLPKSYIVLHFILKSMIYLVLIFVQDIRIKLRHGCFINRGQIIQALYEFKSNRGMQKKKLLLKSRSHHMEETSANCDTYVHDMSISFIRI